MKKNLLFLLLLFLSSSIFFSCNPGDEDDIPSPDKKVDDPTGTVIVSVPSGNYFCDIRLQTSGNFSGSGWRFHSMGVVAGLGNVVVIPQGEYVLEYAVREGYGYVGQRVVSDGCEYIRFWVEYYDGSAANIRYQTPFAGQNKDISVVSEEISFNNNKAGSGEIQFKELIEFKLSKTASWISISNIGTKSFKVDVTANPDIADREAAITIKSGTKEKQIKIKQKGRTTFSGGTGAQNDPYLVTTVEQLAAIGTYGCYKITKNIDLTDYLKNSETGWEPFEFSGSLDGGGYTVSGLWMNVVGDAGLFTQLTGSGSVVANLNINIGSKGITGSRFVGGIAGNSGGTINRCSVNGNVSGQIAGGIVGYGSSSITNSFSSGNITGTQEARGIGGSNITDSYSIANLTVNGSSGNAYGISNGTAIRCYYAGNITAGGSVAKYGVDSRNYNNYDHSYYDSSKAGDGIRDTSNARTTAQMRQKTTYQDWDFTTVWQINEGVSYPTLR